MSSIDWKKTRKRQIRLGGAITLLIVLLTVGLLILVNGPIRSALHQRDIEQFRAQGLFIQSEVSSYFDQSEQLAQQIPSRTRIREELVAYLQGDRTEESYVAFAQPKLLDAVEAAPALVGVYRYNPAGEPLVPVNLSVDQLPVIARRENRTYLLPKPIFANGREALLFVVPIWHSGFGIAGYDIVAVATDELAERIEVASGRTLDARIAIIHRGDEGVTVPLESKNSDPAFLQSLQERYSMDSPGAPAHDETVVLEVGREMWRTVSFGLRDGWIVTVSNEEDALHQASRFDLRLFSFTVIFLGAAASIGSSALLRLIAKRDVADKQELTRIISDQTQDLELLLKEVHHRVKNDISLMTSFISLKMNQVLSQEAQDALSEVKQSLVLMHHVYERLQTTDEYGTVGLGDMVGGIARDVESATRGAYSIATDLRNLKVERRIAIPIGIMVNELLTNAVKHGTPGTEVTVSLAPHENTGIAIDVRSDRGAFPQTTLEGNYGFGLSMVAALTEQYGGILSIFNDPSAHVVVRIPDATVSTDIEGRG